ncbi:MAG TPA: hypothetical protein VHC63_18850 [Acidimicrobiales bacterium]|nr:hypothetical protein [Acidimicrobiales bacterium]
MTEPLYPRQQHSNDLKNDTDLPLPRSGNGGNESRASNVPAQPTAAELMAALDDALLVPDGPPLHEVDPQTVLDWAERASERLLFRRDRVRLVRDVLRVLDDEWRSAYAADQLRQQIEARERDRIARAQGTYWQRRDSYRSAEQATHVVVDRGAWGRAKAVAVARRTTVGVIVGDLVAAEVRRPRPRRTHPGESETRVFARITITKETWAIFRSLASRNHTTAERALGSLVEAAFPQDRAGR